MSYKFNPFTGSLDLVNYPSGNYVDIERDLGLVPFDEDAGVENASKLQTYINSLGESNYLPIFIPGKPYAIATTIQLYNQGGTIIGAGSGNGYTISAWGEPGNENQVNSVSKLIWTGNSTDPMIVINGQHWNFDKFGLSGWWNATLSSVIDYKCAEGIRVINLAGSIVSGKIVCGDMSFEYFGYAVRFPSNFPNNADNMVWNRVATSDNTIFYSVEDNQSNSHTFNKIFVGSSETTDIILNASSGGDITVNDLKANLCGTILRITGGEHGTDNFVIRNFKADASWYAGPDKALVDLQYEDSKARIRISGISSEQGERIAFNPIKTSSRTADIQLDISGMANHVLNAWPVKPWSGSRSSLPQPDPVKEPPTAVFTEIMSGELWLEADDPAYYTTDSDGLLTWLDRTGTGNDMSQSSNSLQPSIDEDGLQWRPTVFFDSDAWMENTAPVGIGGVTDITIFAVVRATDVQVGGTPVILSNYTGTGNQKAWMLRFVLSSLTVQWVQSTNGSTDLILSAGKLWTNKRQSLVIMERESSTGAVRLTVDGEQLMTTTSPTATFSILGTNYIRSMTVVDGATEEVAYNPTTGAITVTLDISGGDDTIADLVSVITNADPYYESNDAQYKAAVVTGGTGVISASTTGTTATISSTGALHNSTAPLKVGCQGASSDDWDGDISHVSMRAAILTPAEIDARRNWLRSKYGVW